jgi:hypothetical protein
MDDAEYALQYDGIGIYTPFVHNILLNCIPEVRNSEDFKENLIIYNPIKTLENARMCSKSEKKVLCTMT